MITDHHDKYIIVNKLEILGKLPKTHPDVRTEPMLSETSANRPSSQGAVTNLQFVKNTISAKHSVPRYSYNAFFLKLGVNTQMFTVISPCSPHFRYKVKDIL